MFVAGAVVMAPAYADESADVTLTGAPGWTMVQSTVLEHGTIVKKWSNGDLTVGVAAPPGTVVDADGSAAPSLVGVSADTPADKSDEVPQWLRTDSLVSMVEALGMAHVDAVRIFGAADGTRLIDGASADAGKVSETLVDPLVDTIGAPEPRSHVCLSMSGHEGKVKAYGCNQQLLDYARKGDWYLADKFLLSGNSTDNGNWFPARLTSLRAKVSYPNSGGNAVLHWSPASTRNLDRCKSETTSVSDTKSGASYSSTSEVCPDTFGPWALAAAVFGSRWDGDQPAANHWESTNGAMYTHNPPAASPRYTFRVEMSWER